MRAGLRGNALPETEDEFNTLLSRGQLMHKTCIFCNKEFGGRTHTRLGWAETQISGSCEDCFDELTKEDDE